MYISEADVIYIVYIVVRSPIAVLSLFMIHGNLRSSCVFSFDKKVITVHLTICTYQIFYFEREL